MSYELGPEEVPLHGGECLLEINKTDEHREAAGATAIEDQLKSDRVLGGVRAGPKGPLNGDEGNGSAQSSIKETSKEIPIDREDVETTKGVKVTPSALAPFFRER